MMHGPMKVKLLAVLSYFLVSGSLFQQILW